MDQRQGARVPKNLYQRGGIFYARIQVAGAERRVSLKTADRREAARRLRTFLEENSPYHGTIRRSFDSVIEGFLDEAKSRLKPKTLKRYDVSAVQLMAKWSGQWWDSVTRRSVVEYIDERKATGTKIPTIRRDLTVLSQAAEWAIERGIGGVNPVGEVGQRQLRYKKPVFARPNPESVEATINATYGNLKPLARFLLATGMRLDEAATLRTEQVDLARKVATLVDTKNGRPRAVTLSDAAVAIVKAQPDGEYVFPSRDGEPYKQASTNWQEAKARARKSAQKEGWRYTPFRLHDLRHIYAIDYLANGGNLYALQRQLGHGTIRQTEEYLQHLSPEEAKLAVDRSAQNTA
jgi:integrase